MIQKNFCLLNVGITETTRQAARLLPCPIDLPCSDIPHSAGPVSTARQVLIGDEQVKSLTSLPVNGSEALCHDRKGVRVRTAFLFDLRRVQRPEQDGKNGRDPKAPPAVAEMPVTAGWPRRADHTRRTASRRPSNRAVRHRPGRPLRNSSRFVAGRSNRRSVCVGRQGVE